jgi:hypothetical protein
VPHANATLTERGRLNLARCVAEDGWPLRRAAERFQVSHNTARRWPAESGSLPSMANSRAHSGNADLGDNRRRRAGCLRTGFGPTPYRVSATWRAKLRSCVETV